MNEMRREQDNKGLEDTSLCCTVHKNKADDAQDVNCEWFTTTIYPSQTQL